MICYVPLGMMNELLMSPESEQAKSITLVRALQKQAKSHPYKMFNTIEFFLHDGALKPTGREMWRETGTANNVFKRCNRRDIMKYFFMQEKFVLKEQLICLAVNNLFLGTRQHIKVNHYHSLSFAGSDVHTTETDVSLFSEAGGTSSASQALLSQEVSRSVPQSSLSPVLAKYKKYLQSCYKARVLAPADKYLPTLESPYINLAMIRRGCYNHEQRDEFTKRTLHGGVDQILQNKAPINIEDLYTGSGPQW